MLKEVRGRFVSQTDGKAYATKEEIEPLNAEMLDAIQRYEEEL